MVLYSLLVSVFLRVGQDYDLGLVNLVDLFDYRTKSNGSVRGSCYICSILFDCRHQSNSMERLRSIDFDLNFCSVFFD